MTHRSQLRLGFPAFADTRHTSSRFLGFLPQAVPCRLVHFLASRIEELRATPLSHWRGNVTGITFMDPDPEDIRSRVKVMTFKARMGPEKPAVGSARRPHRRPWFRSMSSTFVPLLQH